MKIAWITFLVLGILLILFNLPVYLMGVKKIETPGVTDEIAYQVGLNAGFILGAIFLFLSYVIRRKWKRKKVKKDQQEMLNSIGSIDISQY